MIRSRGRVTLGHNRMEVPNMQFIETIWADTIKEAVHEIAKCLETATKPNHVAYFHGWKGLGASVVLKSIAKDPPPSLRRKFDSIIHINCSRWKNRREIQRIIVQKLLLPEHVMDIFSRQDEEDDIEGVDEGSRAEIPSVGAIINQALRGLRWLVVFHNGSNRMVNFNDFGIPQPDKWLNGTVLWTYSGRLRGILGFEEAEHKRRYELIWGPNTLDQTIREQGVVSHIYLSSMFKGTTVWTKILHEEATEIARYANKLGVTSERAAAFCRYLLSLNSMGFVLDKGKGFRPSAYRDEYSRCLDFNWPTHASNYWVCDEITQDCQQDKEWELATAMHEQMRLGDFSCYRFSDVGATKRWIVATSFDIDVQPETTSFFVAKEKGEYSTKEKVECSVQHIGKTVPNRTFQRAKQLRVLKLCHCLFSFSSPPFLHCRTIRFLGLDNCMDVDIEPTQKYIKEEDKNRELRQKKEFFQSLCVLDLCCTDWELNLPPNIIEKMAMNMREISIKQGRIWHVTHAWTWRHLQNVHKLRVIEPTCPWETGSQDQFMGMVKLELLDLSGNITMQVLPSLSGSTSLSILVLDGCIGLKSVTPGTLPQSLETFSFDAGAGKWRGRKVAKISYISVAGCSRLVNFRLCGSLGNLEELDLSNTSIKVLDLRDNVQVPCLQHVIMMGCEQLRVVLWPKTGVPKLTVLCIDTRGGEVARTKISHHSLVFPKKGGHCHACVSIMDMRFIQLLVLPKEWQWITGITARFNLNLCLTCRKDDGQSYRKDKMVPCSTKELAGSPLHKSLIPWTHRTYSGINVDKATINIQGNSARQFEPLDVHIDIAEGISNTSVVLIEAVKAVIFVMDRVESLVVHDNSSIATVTPLVPGKGDGICWNNLKLCRVERCSKLDTVFNNNCPNISFPELETFWAVDLLVARSIWSKRVIGDHLQGSFGALRSLNICFCPRLTFVLPLPWSSMCCLEILQIICCGDLTHVFPADAAVLNKISTGHQRGVLKIPNLKQIYLYELPKLHQICETKMFAPSLETITIRGCWSLKCLPVTYLSSKGDRSDNCPVMDCEKDWWEKLEWDGKEQGHYHSLFKLRHSKYYKKTMLRGTALR